VIYIIVLFEYGRNENMNLELQLKKHLMKFYEENTHIGNPTLQEFIDYLRLSGNVE